jgi:hypothetical protein
MMQQILLGQGGAAGINVDDLFAVTTYTGNASSRSIDNGLDLDGDGGIVWIKSRNLTTNHILHSTEFPSDVVSVSPNSTDAYSNHGSVVTGFNSNGWTMGSSNLVNGNNDTYVAWSFVKAEKFFDVVTYSGNSTSGRTISHNLGAVPGAIWVKEVTSGDIWACYHSGLGNTAALALNQNGPGFSGAGYWNNTSPTSSVFTVGSDNQVNGSSRNYVAFLFAEDTEDLIKCDDYNGNGGTQTIDCGFQPQFVLIKCLASGSNDWVIFDSARSTNYLRPNNNNTEATHVGFAFASNGFTLSNAQGITNGSGKGYSYIAIAS